MEKIIIFSVLIFIGSCHGFHMFDNEIEDSVFVSDADKTCEKQGLLCKNCNTLVRCIEEEEGEFTEIVVDHCNATQTCIEDEKKCSNDYNPSCTNINYEFKCKAIGMFPNPYDCKKYHICTKNANNQYVLYNYSCTGNWTYNMISTYCDIYQEHCDKQPVPVCQHAGDVGALENKSLWYNCVDKDNSIVPELHLCANGKWFVNNGCISKNELSSTTRAPTESPMPSTTEEASTT